MSSKFAGNIRDGLLVNANAGGENVHRGELLGFVLGLNEATAEPIDDFVSGLHDGKAIKAEIEAFITAVSNPRSGGSVSTEEGHEDPGGVVARRNVAGTANVELGAAAAEDQKLAK